MSFVSATKAGGFVASYSHTVPSGVANNDLMILFASANDFDVMTTPTGWTLENRTQNGTGTATWVFSRVASSEPASYTLTWNGAHWHRSQMLAFRGYTGVKNLSAAVNASATSLNMPQLSAASGDMLVGHGFNWISTTKTFPSPLITALTETGNGGGVSAYESRSSSGLTPAYTFSSGSAGRVTTYAVLLEPTSSMGVAESASAMLSLNAGLGAVGSASAGASSSSLASSASFSSTAAAVTETSSQSLTTGVSVSSTGAAAAESPATSLGVDAALVNVTYTFTGEPDYETLPVLLTEVPSVSVATMIPDSSVLTDLDSPPIETDLPATLAIETVIPTLDTDTVISGHGIDTVIDDPAIDTIIRGS